MTTESPFPASPFPPQPPVQAQPKPRRLRRFAYAIALLTGGGIIGAVVAGPVIGQGWYGPPTHHGWGYGPGGYDQGTHPRGFGGMHGPARFERGMDRVMWFVDATPEQRRKLQTIVGRTADDLLALRDKHVESHKQISVILGAPTVDRAKLDTLRTEQMALADTASKRITDAVAEAADVLTPTQRADLARWFDRWHRWRHG